MDDYFSDFQVIISMNYKDYIKIRKPIGSVLIKQGDFSKDVFGTLLYTVIP